MKPTIIFRGSQVSLGIQESNHHIIRGLVTPFIGYEETEAVPQLGFGIYTEDGLCIFYSGGALPLDNIIQAWRSVKIIEKLTGIARIMMSDIWASAGKGLMPILSSIDSVALLYSEPTIFKSVVEEILAQAPLEKDLDFMIKNCLKNNVPINLHEVAYEIALGIITESEYFSELRKEKKIPIPVIEEKRKPIFDDEDLDLKLHEFHEIAIILEKEIVNPETDYLKMYEELKAKTNEDIALLLMTNYMRRICVYSKVAISTDEFEERIDKNLRFYKII